MQKCRLFLLACLLVVTTHGVAQKAEFIQKYIATYKDLAIAEMQRTGVPAAIKLAQGIHETSAGTSDLVLRSNNHFGIKCKSNWTGESVSHDDDARGECFRKYGQAEDSYRDHSDFLKNGQRYGFLFQLDPTDYKGWANGLKKAGYATNPKYPLVLIKLIEDYQLEDYTLIALGKITPSDVAVNTTEPIAAAIIPTIVETQELQKGIQLIQDGEWPFKQTDYPLGEFRINDTKVVFVKKGTSYLSIAQQYNVSLARLFEFNELSESETTANDQLVYLQRKRKTGKNDVHIVKAGESLQVVAQLEAIRLESLAEYNMLEPDMLPAIGEKLALRTKASSRPKLQLKDNYSIAPASFKKPSSHR